MRVEYSRDSGIIGNLIILRCFFLSGLVVYPVGLILLLLCLCWCPLQHQQQFIVLVEAMASSSSTSSSSSSSMPVPKLVAFDLDGTIWSPDMYMLWGGGSPFRVVSKTELRDRQNQKVQLLGISGEILDTIATARDTNADDQDAASSTWPDPKTIVAWVSCTDEPRWAEECMQKFRTPRNVPLVDRVDVQCIYKANKQTHFRDLQQQYPQIEFCDMLFFDNERSNIHEVQKLGVHSVYCPKGMTQQIWEQGLASWRQSVSQQKQQDL